MIDMIVGGHDAIVEGDLIEANNYCVGLEGEDAVEVLVTYDRVSFAANIGGVNNIFTGTIGFAFNEDEDIFKVTVHVDRSYMSYDDGLVLDDICKDEFIVLIDACHILQVNSFVNPDIRPEDEVLEEALN